MDAARYMGELLSFARLRLLRLGDLDLPCEVNPAREAVVERPLDTLATWIPWEDLQPCDDDRDQSDKEGDGQGDSPIPPSPPPELDDVSVCASVGANDVGGPPPSGGIGTLPPPVRVHVATGRARLVPRVRGQVPRNNRMRRPAPRDLRSVSARGPTPGGAGRAAAAPGGSRPRSSDAAPHSGRVRS